MIEIDLTWFNQFYGMNPILVGLIFIFKYYLWVPLLYVILTQVVYPLWMHSRREKWGSKQKYIYLAIDVPKKNEQSIKGMEQIFVQLLGGHASINKYEKYIEGVFQQSFSFEIVSIDGFIQFLIRTPANFRDLVEDSIYAQYPDAEITEVEDYTKNVPRYYPNETHNLFGVEFYLDSNQFYPIRTYPMFEHVFAKTYVDPLAALLEAMSKIGKGEQIWIQLIAKPLAPNWAKDKGGEKFIKKLIGAKVESKKTIVDTIMDKTFQVANEFTTQLVGEAIAPAAEEKKPDLPSMMMHMSPGEKEKVELVEKKMQKQGYAMKMRMIYVAEKDRFKKSRAINPIIGAIKQFGLIGSNGFRPAMDETATTKPKYYLVKQRTAYRQNLIMKAYASRDRDYGMKEWILNVEELASFWHFPSMYVKAPLIKKTEITKAEPPATLPFEISEEEKAEEEEKIVPETQSVTPTFDYDNDEFERRFAHDKELFEETRPQRQEVLDKIAKEEDQKLKQLQAEEAKAAVKVKSSTDKKSNQLKNNFKQEVESREIKAAPPGNLPFVD